MESGHLCPLQVLNLASELLPRRLVPSSRPAWTWESVSEKPKESSERTMHSQNDCLIRKPSSPSQTSTRITWPISNISDKSQKCHLEPRLLSRGPTPEEQPQAWVMVNLWSQVRWWNIIRESRRTTLDRHLLWAKWRASRSWLCPTMPLSNLLLMTCRQTKWLNKCRAPKCKLRICRPSSLSHSQYLRSKKLLSQLPPNKKLLSKSLPRRRCVLKKKPKTRQPAVRPLRLPQVSLTTTTSRRYQNDPTV